MRLNRVASFGGLISTISAPRHERRHDVVRAFLKWPGGKSWIAESLACSIRPWLKGKYVEPFLGSGAVFLALAPRYALLSDNNFALISALDSIRDNPKAILHALWRFSNTKECYYRV